MSDIKFPTSSDVFKHFVITIIGIIVFLVLIILFDMIISGFLEQIYI